MASKTQFTSFVDDLNAEAVVERNYLNGKPYSSAFYRLYNTRKRLPVFQFKEKFLKMLANHQVLVLTGETGSGKTTQIPQWCVEYSMSCSKNGEDTGRVVCTQPRRMAALSIATRVAQEMDVTLGEEVGYCYRFENCTSSQTVLKYTTDGFLLRECIPDRMLTNYRVVIIDEAHERTVATDALLGVLKQSIQERCDLKIIVMSATMDADKFQRYFGNAPLLSIPGRTYPVEIIYSSPRHNYLDEIISTVIKIHTKEQIAGDILVFLTGQDEIEKAWERIEMEISKLGLAETFCCLPLYGVLPPEEQQRIYEPPPPNCGGFIGRKVILSTNIAEASLTVDGVRFVVDCGFVKQKVYNPHKRMDTLLNVLTSKASAEQRAGRAGRTGPGKCYRMYTFEKYSNMPEYTVPEILRTNLGSVVLQLKKLGITDLENFGFIDPPGKELVKHAEELVTILGAVDANGQLTDAGELMVHFPVDPQMAKILIASWKYRCVDEIFTIVALLSTGQSAFTNPRKYKTEANEARKKFVDPKSDHLTLLNAYNEFLNNGESHDWCRMNYLNYRVLSNAYKHKKDLLTALDKINLQLPPTSAKANRLMITKALASGLFMQVAHLNKGYTYFTVKENLEVVLHPSNCLIKPFPQWVLYTELTLTSKNYIRLVTAVEPDVFLNASPSFFKPASLPLGRARTLLEIMQATDTLVEGFDVLDLFL